MLTLAHPRCFDPHLDLRLSEPPPPPPFNSCTAASIELKLLQDTYVSEKCFVWIAFVLFTLLHAVSMKTGGSLSIKSLIYDNLDNLFLSVGCPGLAHSKNINFIGRECKILRGMGGSIGTWWEKCHSFPEAPPISLIF